LPARLTICDPLSVTLAQARGIPLPTGGATTSIAMTTSAPAKRYGTKLGMTALHGLARWTLAASLAEITFALK
jgi:hypothetical protein